MSHDSWCHMSSMFNAFLMLLQYFRYSNKFRSDWNERAQGKFKQCLVFRLITQFQSVNIFNWFKSFSYLALNIWENEGKHHMEWNSLAQEMHSSYFCDSFSQYTTTSNYLLACEALCIRTHKLCTPNWSCIRPIRHFQTDNNIVDIFLDRIFNVIQCSGHDTFPKQKLK